MTSDICVSLLIPPHRHRSFTTICFYLNPQIRACPALSRAARAPYQTLRLHPVIPLSSTASRENQASLSSPHSPPNLSFLARHQQLQSSLTRNTTWPPQTASSTRQNQCGRRPSPRHSKPPKQRHLCHCTRRRLRLWRQGSRIVSLRWRKTYPLSRDRRMTSNCTNRQNS